MAGGNQTKRSIARIGLIAAVLVVATATAAHAQYEPGVLSVSTTNPTAGQSITASGSGCSPGSTVSFSLAGAAVGSTTASSTGGFSGIATIPSSTSAGNYTLTATCGSLVLSASLRVSTGGSAAAPVSLNSGSTLPFTGSSSKWFVAIASALLASGGLLLLAVRKSKRVTA